MFLFVSGSKKLKTKKIKQSKYLGVSKLKQTNKQTNQQASKQINKQTIKSTNKQINKQTSKETKHLRRNKQKDLGWGVSKVKEDMKGRKISHKSAVCAVPEIRNTNNNTNSILILLVRCLCSPRN